MCRYRGNINICGPLPDSIPDLQVYLSWGSIVKRFHSLRSLLAASVSSLASQAHTFLKPYAEMIFIIMQGPVVQSFVSLTSLLRVISLTVLADSIYNILIFFAEKLWVAFALQKLLTFFQQKISEYCVSLDVKFNELLTNDVVSFEQLGPGLHSAVCSALDWRSRGCKFSTKSKVEIDPEITSMVILPLLLIQEGQLSVTDKKYLHKELVYYFED